MNTTKYFWQYIAISRTMYNMEDCYRKTLFDPHFPNGYNMFHSISNSPIAKELKQVKPSRYYP